MKGGYRDAGLAALVNSLHGSRFRRRSRPQSWLNHCPHKLRCDPTPPGMLLQPDPRSPNRLQRFACSCFSPSKTNPATSYLGLFVVSVSILKGVIVKSELLPRFSSANIKDQCGNGG